MTRMPTIHHKYFLQNASFFIIDAYIKMTVHFYESHRLLNELFMFFLLLMILSTRFVALFQYSMTLQAKGYLVPS